MNSYAELMHRRDGKRIMLTPKDLLSAAVEYFQWAEDNPLSEEKVFHAGGMITRADIEKVRPLTMRALANYHGMTSNAFERHEQLGDEWQEVMDLTREVIYTQKFDNAVAGLMNAQLISRDLGLAERSEVSGPDGQPVKQTATIDFSKFPTEALAELQKAFDLNTGAESETNLFGSRPDSD